MNATIVESIFNVAYFLTAWSLVVLLARKFSRSPGADKPLAGRFLLAFALLAFGDSFHVGARVFSSIVGAERAVVNLGGIPSSLIGLGMLATSYTITGFYMVMTDARRLRAGEKTDPLFWTMQALLAARLIVMALPGNAWESGASPFAMGLFRNLFLILPGAVLAARFILDGRGFKDRSLTLVGWCMAASFACYAAVILLNDAFPMIGMLMLPKTVAYVVMGIALVRRPSEKP
jgi:hypothetical protein